MEGPWEENESVMDLPPGFRFHPTDEELISNYLMPKVINGLFSAVAVGEVDLNKCEPWDLPKKAKMGEKEWYFYCNRDRKYPTGTRTNRATESGYWKATGKDKEIYKMGKSGCLIGMKKTLVFYKGRAPKGEKTNWVMHEYRLEGEFSYYKFPNKDEWVVSRIFHKISGTNRNPIYPTKNSPYQYDPHLSEYCSTISQLPSLVENPASSSLIDENEMSEGITKASFSQSIEREEDDYLSYLSNLEDHQLHKHNTDNFTPHNHNNHFGMIKPDYSIKFYPQSQFPNQEYLLREKLKGQNHISSIANQVIFKALEKTEISVDTEKQCKVEQLSSNQSMVSVSHDTGISTDMTAETSSRPNDKIYELFGINVPNLDGCDNVSDGFDCLWDF